MNPNEPCFGQPFRINESDLIQTIITVYKENGIAPDIESNQEEYQNLLNISQGKCSRKTKDTAINFMLKFGESYKKNYPELIDQLRKFENRSTKQKHRDHICHSFRVWCLGYWLYRNGFKKFFESSNQSTTNFNFVWYLTAFYHDIGYVEKHRCHGGDSAQILLKKLNERFNGVWSTDAIHAIVAICLHDKKEPNLNYQPVDILKNPYSALLIICDEIQEWGRNLPQHDKRFEIDKLQFCMNLSTPNPSLEIMLFYPENKQSKPIDELKKFVKEKEHDFRNTLSRRIQNILIIVRCEPY